MAPNMESSSPSGGGGGGGDGGGNGKRFVMPVDSDHKATEFWIFSLAAPHMRAFHLSWFSFFCCFCSTFATPPLLPVIRDNIGLTATDIGNAGIASVSGAVFARLVMGTACDLLGPRLASATLALATAPAVFLTALVSSPSTFLAARFLTGFSLATFVSTQFWMSSLFSPPKVGLANSFAGGWGNVGGGAVQLLMPLVYSLIKRLGATSFTAWRIAFFVPGMMQATSALAILSFGQDLPNGNFSKLHKTGEKRKDNFSKVLSNALGNYRGWLLALTYGYCFGVELTIDNIAAQYFYDRFGVNITVAGFIAASFGVANVFTRPGGGFLSDAMARRFGMRGRLWSLWATQTVGGLMCILLGRMGSLTSSVVILLLFSFFVQAACGLTFGVVPFVSRRSLGLISGMTGGGGNVGAVLTQLIFFKGSRYSTETGITLMGMMILCCTIPVMFIYFPQWGGMFCGPNENVTEEDYYAGEWSSTEKEKGFHLTSMKWANNSKSERGKQGDSSITVPMDGTPIHV